MKKKKSKLQTKKFNEVLAKFYQNKNINIKKNFNKKFAIAGKIAAMHNIQRASGRRGN